MDPVDLKHKLHLIDIHEGAIRVLIPRIKKLGDYAPTHFIKDLEERTKELVVLYQATNKPYSSLLQDAALMINLELDSQSDSDKIGTIKDSISQKEIMVLKNKLKQSHVEEVFEKLFQLVQNGSIKSYEGRIILLHNKYRVLKTGKESGIISFSNYLEGFQQVNSGLLDLFGELV